MFTPVKITAAIFGASLLFAACQQSGNSDEKKIADTTTVTVKEPITVSEVGQSPDFKDAMLAIKSVKAEKAGTDSAKVSFEFDVKNYDLKMQTTDTGSKQCNNSKDGQHIHFILDNKPYKALYEPKNDVTLAVNTEHYLMAFLSRSYHESIKTKGAAVMYHFKIDEKGALKKLDDPKTPMLFYSRPKGDYIGKDSKNVLLDYYLWNTDLSASGYKVKAQITTLNGSDTTITMDTWKPLFIHGLFPGKNTIKLTLVDKDGNDVAGPETAITRDFNVAESEPMKN